MEESVRRMQNDTSKLLMRGQPNAMAAMPVSVSLLHAFMRREVNSDNIPIEDAPTSPMLRHEEMSRLCRLGHASEMAIIAESLSVEQNATVRWWRRVLPRARAAMAAEVMPIQEEMSNLVRKAHRCAIASIPASVTDL